MKRGSRKSGFAGMSPEARRAAQSKGGKEAQRRRKFAKAQMTLGAVVNAYASIPHDIELAEAWLAYADR